jgi:transposase
MKFMLYDQNQSTLLPPTLAECLPDDHISFIINDVVSHMDLSVIEAEYTEVGHPSYHPKMMIKILFYGYLQGVRSSRKLENKTFEDIAFRYLCANARVDHGTINLFRKNHLSELPFIFAQIITVAKTLKLADFSDVSTDGTKIKAQASTGNLFNKEEISKLKGKIASYLAEVEKIDDEEDKIFGNARGYNQIPARLVNPKTRQEEIRKIQKRLDDLNKADIEIDRKQVEAKSKDKTKGTAGKAKKQESKANNLTSNTTDPEAALMKMKDKSYKMAYNVGITAAHQFIAAYDVTSDPADTDTLPEMVKITELNTKEKVKTAKADSTYFTKENIAFCKENQIEALIPDTLMKAQERKERKEEKENTKNKYDRNNFTYDSVNDRFTCPEGNYLKLQTESQNKIKTYKGESCQNCPHLSLCAKGKARYLQVDPELEQIRTAMRAKLNTKEGKAKYAERLPEVEPVMADLKRNQGFGEFLCVGKTMALVEIGLASSAHNLKKIFLALQRKGIKRKEIEWNSLIRPQTA